MPPRIALRKADLEILAVVDDLLDGLAEGLSPKQHKAWSLFHERVLAAEMKPKKEKQAEGIPVRTAIEIFRGALGRRLVEPVGRPSQWWFVRLQNKLNDSGVTDELARRAAEVAGAQWKGSIKVESIINNVDRLLSDSNMDLMADVKSEAQDMIEL
jgi:hypothetical protein